MCKWLQVAPLVMLALAGCGDRSQQQAARVSGPAQPDPSPPTVERVLLWQAYRSQQQVARVSGPAQPDQTYVYLWQAPPTTRTWVLLREGRARVIEAPTWPIRNYWQWEREQRRGPNGFLPGERPAWGPCQ